VNRVVKVKKLTINLLAIIFRDVLKFLTKKVIKMMNVSVAPPTIIQTLQSLNSPQLPNFNVGTANVEASAGAMASSAATTSGSVGSSCGSSVDTYA
jgi:hypothetical protein